MQHRLASSCSGNSKRRFTGAWFNRKLCRIRESHHAQKKLQQRLIIIAAVLIAFIIGFWFLGPGITSLGG